MALDGMIKPITVVRSVKKTKSQNEQGSTLKLKNNKVFLQNPNRTGNEEEKQFKVSYCCSDEAKNGELYENSIMPIVNDCIAGQNALVVALGQRESGKESTMIGSMDEPGIVKMHCMFGRVYYLVLEFCKHLFDAIDKKYTNSHDYLMTVSYFEISDTRIKDILNPSENDPQIKSHVNTGIYFKELSEYCASCEDELVRFFTEGVQLKSFMIEREENTVQLDSSMPTTTFFRIVLHQKENDGSSITSEMIFTTMADSNLAANKRSFTALTEILTSMTGIGDASKRPSFANSNLTHALQNHLNGNCIPVFIAHISPLEKDYQETHKMLQFINVANSAQFKPHINKCNNSVLIADLRSDINSIREKIVGKEHHMLAKTDSKDLKRLEQSIKDLEYFKLQSWTEKQRLSKAWEKERWHNLASRGLIEVVTNPSHQSNTELQKELEIIQKEKNKIMIEYKDKRIEVDALKDKLQVLITEYSKLTESGKSGEEESKRIVPEIHELKEKLKVANEALKKIKQKLKDIQEKQKQQKVIIDGEASSLYDKSNVKTRLEQERREKLTKENRIALANEIERVKIEAEQQKSELKVKYSKDNQITNEEAFDMEMKLVDLKSEKSILAVKVKMEQQEKNELLKDMTSLKQRHEKDLELQQLQHFQVFRQYREIYEEQKVALDQQYRSLLEESIQDAVYLSSRNEELIEENQIYLQELAEAKDRITLLEGKTC